MKNEEKYVTRSELNKMTFWAGVFIVIISALTLLLDYTQFRRFSDNSYVIGTSVTLVIGLILVFKYKENRK